MNQTILRIGFFLVGNHQYFIQNYTQILSFADQNFGSTETPVFWKDREMKQAYLFSVYDNINYRPCFIHVSCWLLKHIHHNRWFIFFFLAKNKNTEVLMHACLWDAVLEWTLSKCIFFLVNYNALRFLTKGCHYSQYSWNFKKVWDMLFSKWII